MKQEQHDAFLAQEQSYAEQEGTYVKQETSYHGQQGYAQHYQPPMQVQDGVFSIILCLQFRLYMFYLFYERRENLVKISLEHLRMHLACIDTNIHLASPGTGFIF